MYNNPYYQPPSPNSEPLYSNIAYDLLGLALMNAHNKSYEQIIDEMIFKPTGMNNSCFAMENDPETEILPIAGEQWDIQQFANLNPTGGIWSTPNDLFKWTKALLNNQLLSAAETRAWLKPHAVLPSLQQLVGAPWEIFRPIDLNIKTKRPIDVITKAGGLKGYSSLSIIVPEYNIAIAITVAGKDATTAILALMPAVINPLIAYADQEARNQAQNKYVGAYSSSHAHTRLEVALDDGPGLALKVFKVNGIDMLAALASVQGIKSANPTARLYPTDKDSFGKDGKEKWNILWDREITGDGGFAQMQCASWNFGDAARYVGQPLDSVVFHIGERGNVASAELPGWRETIVKTA
jgi:hypothetical protein